ncbi:hypothetical protein MPTK1_6g10330 [Marchantia polymorpha subsp. ruderalis]|uniref:Serpin domain-containing protein n=2 Tax=Marchantia polymorpha TaxID=3197 RepID=A0A176W913_MARPO|nr:hypothetical protein AXG93_4003s1110 [Marchantia polymorpha subsp. ruderalis]PTQ45015.1 hypothetical protein MARPO_0016s0076 [Marchantia polymorpha]BBN14279.1 hypothetical protein Mp_6g10330 [Marchantia polymorpha subsp. ruderalis]|eukprot:PTQ45015.1 hypothetical protein MARPO_0016s0076 [Marchantia polymorpha]
MDHAHLQQAQEQTAYTLDLYKQVLKLEELKDNAVMSPMSIATALAMTAGGCRGETLAQFAAHLKHPDSENMHQLSMQINNSIFREGSDSAGPYLASASGLWVDERTPLNPKFRRFVKHNYGGEAQEADFRTKAGEVCNEVNQWVGDQTRGKVSNMLPPGAVHGETRMLLVNALYFRGNWKEKFDIKQTKDKTFYLMNGQCMTVPMMRTQKKQYIKSYSNWSSSDASFKQDLWPMYSFNESHGATDFAPPAVITEQPFEFKVLRLPYKTGNKDHRQLSMYILLPDRKDGLPELERNLDAAWLMRELPTLTRFEPVGEFWLPRFKSSFKFPVNKPLQNLGLTTPFHEVKADFSGMLEAPGARSGRFTCVPGGCNSMIRTSGRRLYLSKVIHEAIVEVREDGGEPVAAPVYGRSVSNCAIEPLYKMDFVADHPFLYLIREDATGVVLFIGRCTHPKDANPLLEL